MTQKITLLAYRLVLPILIGASFNLTAQQAETVLASADAAELLLGDAAPTAADEEAEDVEDKNGLSLSGYVDAYAQYNPITSDQGEDIPLGFPTSFTGQLNQFALGNANLLATQALGKVSFTAQVGFGPRAVAANSDSNLGGAGNFASTIQQLFVSYTPADWITVTLGNFGTFIGYEVIDAPANANYSMSYLFSNGPFYHTGLKADLVLGEGFGAMVGVFNDTDSKIDAISGKHIGGQLSVEAGGFAGYLNGIYGREAQIEVEGGGFEDLNEYEIDLTATYEINDRAMLGLNAARYGTSLEGTKDEGFFGTALYATIATGDAAAISLRGEYFTRTLAESATGDGDSVVALTASGNFDVGPLKIIPELRFDTGSSAELGGLVDSDESAFGLLLAGIYSF